MIAGCLFPSLEGLSSNDASVADADASVGSDADASGIEVGPPAFVQGSAAEIQDASMGIVTFNAAVTTGDTLIVGVDYPNVSGSLKVTDAMNNTFATAYAVQTNILFVALDVKGGIDPVTIDLVGGPVTHFEVYIHEYANISAFDSANGMTGAADAMSSGNITVSQPSELLFGYVTIDYGSGVAGAGFTPRSAFNGNVTEDRLVTTAGAFPVTATKLNGTTWIMLGASFKGF